MADQPPDRKIDSKKNKGKGKTTRVVAMTNAPRVLSGDEERIAAMIAYEATQGTGITGFNVNVVAPTNGPTANRNRVAAATDRGEGEGGADNKPVGEGDAKQAGDGDSEGGKHTTEGDNAGDKPAPAGEGDQSAPEGDKPASGGDKPAAE